MEDSIFWKEAWEGKRKEVRLIENNEIVLENDNLKGNSEEWISEVKKRLNNKYSYEVWSHNGKSPHIHIKNIKGLEELENKSLKQYKESFIIKYGGEGCDLSLAGKHNISKENELHWKKVLNKKGCENYGVKELIEENKIDSENNIEKSLLFESKRKSWKEKLVELGYEINHSDMILCPNPKHNDNNPSCKLYYEEERYFCFGCNKGGKLIYLTDIRKRFIVYEEKKGKLVAKLSFPKLAEYLIENYSFKSMKSEKGEIFYYSDKEGIYKEDGRFFIQNLVQKYGGSLVRNFHISEITGIIRRTTFAEREELYSAPPELCCLNNGILNLNTKELIPHSRDIVFTQKVPIDYNKEDKCPLILKFLNEILEEEDISIIQEYIGYFLYRDAIVKKAMILNGLHDTGKSTLIKLIIKFIGKSNCSEIPLHKLCKDKFSIADMEHKLLNFYDDLSTNDVSDISVLKVITGMGYIDAEKKFRDRYKFKPYAKQLFATNKIPNVKDSDDAYYSRWIPINLNKQIPEDKRDPHLIQKITSKSEMSGFLNWALEGLDRLLENKRLSYNKTPEDIKKIMEYSSNPVSAFQQDLLIPNNNDWISKDDMYNIFLIYANYNGLPRFNKEKFGREVLNNVEGIVEEKRNCENKKEVRGWGGVSISLSKTRKTPFFQIIYKQIKIQYIPKNIEHFTLKKTFPLSIEKVVFPVDKDKKLDKFNPKTRKTPISKKDIIAYVKEKDSEEGVKKLDIINHFSLENENLIREILKEGEVYEINKNTIKIL